MDAGGWRPTVNDPRLSRRSVRDYAYGSAGGLPDTKVGTFPQALLDQAKKNGWTAISMRNDWKLFAFEKMGNMNRVRNKWLMVILLVLHPCMPVLAQTSTTEFLPEIDAFVKLKSNVRFVFQAMRTREGGDPTQAELGPSIDLYLKPLVKLRKITVFDLDDSKSRALVLSIGYRYLPSPDRPAVNRMEPVAIFHFPMKAGILISDRNRADLDWSNGDFTWRYRNRLTLERAIKIRSYHPAPYVRAEVFYESQYSKWSSTELYAGCILPVSKHVEFDPYYKHENNTGKSPNQQVNAVGFIFNLQF